MTLSNLECVFEHVVGILPIGHTWAGMRMAYICATAVFNIIAPKMESRPIELHSEGESEARVEEKAMIHHQTWDARF